MKKYIISLVAALLVLPSAFSQAPAAVKQTAPKTAVSLTGTFEGEYVFRGVQGGTNVGGAAAALTLPSNTEFAVLGLWDFAGINSTVREFDVSLAQKYTIDSATTVSVGGVGYFYPRATAAKGETNYSLEAFASLAYSAFLNPTVSAGYDFNLAQLFAEGSLSQPVKLFFLADGFKLVPAATLGWVSAKDALPEKRGRSVKDAYYYATGKLDFVYETKNAVVGVGYRYNYLDNSAVTKNTWVGGFATIKF